MLNRVVLFAASLSAALVIAGGLALTGMGPGPGAATAPVAEPAAATAEAQPPAPPAVQVDTVYLAPQATPEVITTQVVQTTAAGGEGENENESGDD